MSKLPRCTARQFVRAIEKTGFVRLRQSGSHAIYKAPDGRLVTVPMHSGDLRTPTLAAMLKAAGLTAAQLRELL